MIGFLPVPFDNKPVGNTDHTASCRLSPLRAMPHKNTKINI